MTIEEFAILNNDQKMDSIIEWGFFIGKSATENFNQILYSLHGYFVEVSLSTIDHQIKEIKEHHLLNDHLLQHYSLSSNNPFVKALSH